MEENIGKEVFFFEQVRFEDVFNNVESFEHGQEISDNTIFDNDREPMSYLRLYYETAMQGNSTYWKLRCNSDTPRPIGVTYSVRVGQFNRPITFTTTINPGEIKGLGVRHTPPSLTYRYLRLVSAWWD
jgi:hypothetical protein